MNGTVKIQGLSELLRKLKQFPDNIQKNVSRGAIVGAAMVIRDAAREDVPVATGMLKKNIIASRSRGSKWVAAAKVRIRVLSRSRLAKLKAMGAKGRTARGGYKGDAWYGYIVHQGAKRHTIPYKGRTKRAAGRKVLYWPGAEHPVRRVEHPGMKGRPYLKTAFDSARGPALQRFQDRIVEGIKREAGKR